VAKNHYTNNSKSYIFRSHCATALGSNRTQVPTRNEGIRPAAACLKIVTLDTERRILNPADYGSWLYRQHVARILN
jgi:hypothetical protein